MKKIKMKYVWLLCSVLVVLSSVGVTMYNVRAKELQYDDAITKTKRAFHYKNYSGALDGANNALKVKPKDITATAYKSQATAVLYANELLKDQKYDDAVLKLQEASVEKNGYNLKDTMLALIEEVNAYKTEAIANEEKQTFTTKLDDLQAIIDLANYNEAIMQLDALVLEMSDNNNLTEQQARANEMKQNIISKLENQVQTATQLTELPGNNVSSSNNAPSNNNAPSSSQASEANYNTPNSTSSGSTSKPNTTNNNVAQTKPTPPPSSGSSSNANSSSSNTNNGSSGSTNGSTNNNWTAEVQDGGRVDPDRWYEDDPNNPDDSSFGNTWTTGEFNPGIDW